MAARISYMRFFTAVHIYICYLPDKGRSVWWKTVTSVLKILPEAVGEQIAWENSGIKWMKVPSFSLTVTKYLTF